MRSAEAARKISVCVMDEASQCVEPESLIPLKLGFKKLVMVGDHEQLQVCDYRDTFCRPKVLYSGDRDQ